MGYTLGMTGEELNKVVTGRYHSFIQDIHDGTHTSVSPQSITANTPVLYTNDGTIPIRVVAPDYITDRWDTTNNKMVLSDELNTPTYVAEVGFTFDPATAASGTVELTMWIDDATPKKIKTYRANYKATANPQVVIATWYLGDETEYDAKNDGIYFQLEFSDNGDLYDKTLVIYRT